MAVNGMVKLKSKSEKAKSPMRIYRADFLRSRLLNRATNTKMFPTGIGKYCRCMRLPLRLQSWAGWFAILTFAIHRFYEKSSLTILGNMYYTAILFILKSLNIGFLTNGAGKNFILAQAIGQESYSYELVIGQLMITLISRKFYHQGENGNSRPGGQEFLFLPWCYKNSCPTGREFSFLPWWWGKDKKFLPFSLLLIIIRIIFLDCLNST